MSEVPKSEDSVLASNSASGKKRKTSKDSSSVANGAKRRKISEEEESIITDTKGSIHPHADGDEDDEDSKIKWKTLEHHAVRFPPFYTPHGVAPLHKGKPLKLTPAQEEIATFWAQALGTDFTEKETVRKNFEAELFAVLTPEMGVKSLNDIDFEPIVKHLEKMKEERNNRPNEVKKKEREQNAKMDTYYRYCIIDGERERVNTVMVEPPGIFRGRGEHPGAGKLKSRILPENVTVNVGLDNMIPKCDIPGHSWKAVVNNPEATWLGQFKDEGRDKSGTKYLFLAADSKIKAKNDIKKYGKAKTLKENIESIRADYMKRMASERTVDAQLATATYLIDKLALRVGNEKSEDEADTVGCCSLRVEHITVEKDNKITLDFLGKDSMRFHQTIDVHPVAHKAISKFVKGKKKDEDLFNLINASRLNEYLKELMPGLSAKVFRTYNASITLQTELAKYEEKPRDDVDKKVKFYKNANREVAILCNHQKAVPKNFEEQLERLVGILKEKKKKLKDLQAHKKSLSKDPKFSKPKMPKSLSA